MEDYAPVEGGAAELGQIIVALQEGNQNKVEPRHVAVTLQQTNVSYARSFTWTRFSACACAMVRLRVGTHPKGEGLLE
jgi:hypothetical protein